MPAQSPHSKFCSVAEIAAALGVSERSVRERLHHRDPLTGRQLIPFQRFGRRILVPRVWLERFVADAEAEAAR
jgi:hypothetical protein